MNYHQRSKEFYKRLRENAPSQEEQSKRVRESLMRHKYSPRIQEGKENENDK